MRSTTIACWLLTLAMASLAVHAAEPRPDARDFMREVDRRLDVPAEEQAGYAKKLEEALAQAAVEDPRPQYYVMVDRSARLQAVFIYWRSPESPRPPPSPNPRAGTAARTRCTAD